MRADAPCCSIGMPKVLNDEDSAGRIGPARMLLKLHFPRFMGFGQFWPNSLSLKKQISRVLTLKRLCIGKQPEERRASSRRYHIEGFRLCRLDAGVANLGVDLHSPHRLRKEFA